MYATQDLGDAIDVTRNFLTPVSAAFWLKLTVVVFFVSGTGSGMSFPTGDPTGGAGGEEVPVEEYLPELVVVGLLVLAVVLVFAFVAAVMEFVLIESLRSTEVHVRRYAKRNVGRGAQLLGFQIALWLAVAAAIGLPLVAAWVTFSSLGDVGLLAIVAFVPYALAVLLAFSVIGRFTTEFVVPVMLREDRGVVSAWKRFWPALRADWKEYLVYYILSWLVQMVVGFALGIAMLVLFFVFAIPFIIFAVIAMAAGPIGIAILVLGGLVAFVAFMFVTALIEMPLVAYLRYYALLVLGDTNEAFDLIPDQRAAVRTDGGDYGQGPDRDGGGPDDDWGAGGTSTEGRDDAEGAPDDEWGTGTDATDRRDEDGWNGPDTWDDGDDDEDRY